MKTNCVLLRNDASLLQQRTFPNHKKKQTMGLSILGLLIEEIIDSLN